MMPVVDGYLLKDGVDKLISDPLKVDYMIGYTNNDMYAPAMAYIGNRFAIDNGAYVYFFDIDQPGDGNGAFHSSDLRYMASVQRQRQGRIGTDDGLPGQLCQNRRSQWSCSACLAKNRQG